MVIQEIRNRINKKKCQNIFDLLGGENFFHEESHEGFFSCESEGQEFAIKFVYGQFSNVQVYAKYSSMTYSAKSSNPVLVLESFSDDVQVKINPYGFGVVDKEISQRITGEFVKNALKNSAKKKVLIDGFEEGYSLSKFSNDLNFESISFHRPTLTRIGLLESTNIYFPFEDKDVFFESFDWMGGPCGKKFHFEGAYDEIVKASLPSLSKTYVGEIIRKEDLETLMGGWDVQTTGNWSPLTY